MAKIVQSIAAACKQALASHRVKIAGLAATGMVAAASAAGETFNFSILTDLTQALVALVPDVNSLVSAGGPLVINVCIVAAVCAPFIYIAKAMHAF